MAVKEDAAIIRKC